MLRVHGAQTHARADRLHTPHVTQKLPSELPPGVRDQEGGGCPQAHTCGHGWPGKPEEQKLHRDGRFGGSWLGRTLAGQGQTRGLHRYRILPRGRPGKAEDMAAETGAPSGPVRCPRAPWLGLLRNTALLTPSPEPATWGTCKKRRPSARKSPKPRWRLKQQEESAGSAARLLGGVRERAGGTDRRTEPTPRAHGPHGGLLGHQHGTPS